MKKIFSLLALCALSCFAAEVNLIPDSAGAEKFKTWYNPPSSKITAADGVITITANAADKKANAYQKAQARATLTGDALKSKKFELSFKYRTEKLNGALQVAVREVYQKTGMYHGVFLKKWDVSKEWKEYKHEFTTRPDATELCLYIVGYYMKEGEKVELKDLKLIAK